MPGTDIQRAITVELFKKRRIAAPAIWLKQESPFPSVEDLIKAPDKLTTDIAEWVEGDPRNLGARLCDGYFELRVKAPDDQWSICLFEAFKHLRVDARAAWGVKGKPVSSILMQVVDPKTIEPWSRLWPRGAKDQNDQWIETSPVFSIIPKSSQPLWRESSPLPGSILPYGPVIWRPMGLGQAVDMLDGLEAFEPRPIDPTNMESICRGVAFGTLLYWIFVYFDGDVNWDTSLLRVLGGWIARVEREGADINARGKSLEGLCWSPIDSPETSAILIGFLEAMGAKGLMAHYRRAVLELEAGSNKPAGWPSIERVMKIAARISIRRAFRAGADIDAIERLSERYALDTSTHEYLDREALVRGLSFQHGHDELVRMYENESVFINNKRHNPFKVYAASQLRCDVQKADMFPGEEPGAIVRFSPVYGVLNPEDKRPDEYRALNTFRGFPVKPIGTIDPVVMKKAVTMLDRMLGLLTQDNDAQIKWLKQWIAWIIKHPEIKQQSAPVIIGGQGIGKSLFGDDLMRALFGSLASSTSGSQLTDNNFLITPFIGALVTFLDEVRLEAVSAINEIKKIIRATHISGQVKFGHQRDYYIPSRLIIASNTVNIGLTSEDAADRALFFIMAYTADNKRMTDREFLDWSITLKPFYQSFVEDLEKVEVRQHLMRHFMDVECTRAELEDLTHSSRNDENIIRSTMSKARVLARAMVADARIILYKDLNAWFSFENVRSAIARLDGQRSQIDASSVITEFERAGLIETIRGGTYKFKLGYGGTIKKMGEAHGMPVIPNFDYRPGDFDPNPVLSGEGAPDWRGKEKRQWGRQPSPYDSDPDYMPPQ